MSKHSLLTNRLLMAQGAIALLQKNVDAALNMSVDYDIVRNIEAGDQEDQAQTELPWFDQDKKELKNV